MITALDRTLGRLLPVTTFLVTVAAVLLRQSGVPKVMTVWAEDGLIFATCAYARPLIPDCLLEPYAAWDHLVPRVSATVATMLPPAYLSVGLALSAAVVAGFAAAVVAVAIRDASGSWLAGLLAGTSLVLVIQAGIEVGGNLSNLHYILIAASIAWIVAWLVGARPGLAGLALLTGTGLSSPFTAILVPFALVGAILRRPAWRPIVAIAGVTTLVQLAVNVTTPRMPPGIANLDAAHVIRYVLRDVLGHGVFGPTRLLPLNQLVLGAIVGSVVVAALLAITGQRAPDDRQPDVRVSAYRAILVIASLTGAGIALFVAMLFLQHKFNARYVYVPSALLCIALVFGAALVGRARPVTVGGGRKVLGWAAALVLPAAALVLVLGFARTFRLETKASNGPDYSAAIGSAAYLCRDGAASSIRVPISPIGSPVWVLEIPCSRITVPAGN